LKLSPEVKVPDALINEWEAQNKSELERSRQLLADLQSAGKLDLSMLSVALRQIQPIQLAQLKGLTQAKELLFRRGAPTLSQDLDGPYQSIPESILRPEPGTSLFL
jgi:hypothetical protein